MTFYSLPELSPDETNPAKNCSWVGGNDLNESVLDDASGDAANAATIMLSFNRRIQVVLVEDKARPLKVCHIDATQSKDLC